MDPIYHRVRFLMNSSVRNLLQGLCRQRTFCTTFVVFLSLGVSLFAWGGIVLAQADPDGKSERSAKKERKQVEKSQKDRWKYFSVSSNPEGARVEINGEFLGYTPLKRQIKVKFFYKGPSFAFSSYLNQPQMMTVSKQGYVSKTLLISKGPYQWVSLNGVNRLIFHVVTSPEWDVQLEKVGEFLGRNPFSQPGRSIPTADGKGSALSPTEATVQKALPAVVTVNTNEGSGSGFFILNSGIVVTNRHVVGSGSNVSVVTSKGETFQSKSVYVSRNRDLALIKLADGTFPNLPLADPSTVDVGSEVIAIGSPGVGGVTLQNTVTKGIISSFRNTESNGLLVQTDAALNHGNSGGPLLNVRGEVIGINTLGFADFDKEGLNFAVFVSEILTMLKEQFNYVPEFPKYSDSRPTASESESISAQVTSEPAGAEIYVDGRFLGSTPSKLRLSPGEHTLRIVRPGYKDWERKVLVERATEPSFNALLEKIIQ